jgi:hypothetical protein
MQRLELCVRGDKLPNKDLLDLTHPAATEAPAPEPELPVADAEEATPGLPTTTGDANLPMTPTTGPRLNQ